MLVSMHVGWGRAQVFCVTIILHLIPMVPRSFIGPEAWLVASEPVIFTVSSSPGVTDICGRAQSLLGY